MRISDWSSDVCSSDLPAPEGQETPPWECPRSDTALPTAAPPVPDVMEDMLAMVGLDGTADMGKGEEPVEKVPAQPDVPAPTTAAASPRSEEHTSELQSLMRISYAVFCLKKKKQ